VFIEMMVLFVGHVVSTGKMKDGYTILIRKPEGRNHSEDLGIDVRKLL
jgi:hypothetical protein